LAGFLIKRLTEGGKRAMLGIEGGPRLLLFALACVMTWITNRPPTETDADSDGEVWVRQRPECGGARTLVPWTYVHPGVPWQHTGYHQPPAEPAPTEADRIAALEQRVAADSDRIAALEQRVFGLEVFKRALTEPSPIRINYI
jgi:hypothetical protein